MKLGRPWEHGFGHVNTGLFHPLIWCGALLTARPTAPCQHGPAHVNMAEPCQHGVFQTMFTLRLMLAGPKPMSTYPAMLASPERCYHGTWVHRLCKGLPHRYCSAVSAVSSHPIRSPQNARIVLLNREAHAPRVILHRIYCIDASPEQAECGAQEGSRVPLCPSLRLAPCASPKACPTRSVPFRSWRSSGDRLARRRHAPVAIILSRACAGGASSLLLHSSGFRACGVRAGWPRARRRAPRAPRRTAAARTCTFGLAR